jgi:hypothetical protein
MNLGWRHHRRAALIDLEARMRINLNPKLETMLELYEVERRPTKRASE